MKVFFIIIYSVKILFTAANFGPVCIPVKQGFQYWFVTGNLGQLDYTYSLVFVVLIKVC